MISAGRGFGSGMSLLNDAARAVLTGTGLAHLVTLNEDGSPQVSVVWVGLDGDELVTAHLGAYQKVRNVQRDPRVAISVETGESDPHGLDPYLVVHGTARVQEGGAAALLDELARTYRGAGETMAPSDPPAGYILRITPTKVTGVGPWK